MLQSLFWWNAAQRRTENFQPTFDQGCDGNCLERSFNATVFDVIRRAEVEHESAFLLKVDTAHHPHAAIVYLFRLCSEDTD